MLHDSPCTSGTSEHLELCAAPQEDLPPLSVPLAYHCHFRPTTQRAVGAVMQLFCFEGFGVYEDTFFNVRGALGSDHDASLWLRSRVCIEGEEEGKPLPNVLTETWRDPGASVLHVKESSGDLAIDAHLARHNLRRDDCNNPPLAHFRFIRRSAKSSYGVVHLDTLTCGSVITIKCADRKALNQLTFDYQQSRLPQWSESKVKMWLACEDRNYVDETVMPYEETILIDAETSQESESDEQVVMEYTVSDNVIDTQFRTSHENSLCAMERAAADHK